MAGRGRGWLALSLSANLLAGCGFQPIAGPTPTPTATLTPSSAQSSPSATGPTGDVLTPTAEVPLPATVGKLTHYPSLNGVKSLAFEDDDRLWVGTQLGLVAWDLATDTPTHIAFGECPADLSFCGSDHQWVHDVAVTEDASGDVVVWAATTGGVRRLEAGGRITTFTQADGLPDTAAVSLAIAPDGVVWVGTSEGLASYDGETWRAYADLPGYGGPIWAVDVASTGTVWLSTHDEGVVHYDPSDNTWTRYGTEVGFAYPNARELTVGPDDDVWVYVGYDHVYRFDGTVWSVAYEAGGGQWICDFAFGELPAPYGAASAARLPVIATCGVYHAYGNGIAYPNVGGWAYVTAAEGLPTNGVQAVAISRGSVLAVGTDRGLSVYQEGAWRALRHGPTLNGVTSVAMPRAGPWFGFGDDKVHPAGGGLAHFDGEGWHYVTGIGPGGQLDNVRVLVPSPAGGLWAGAGCLVARQRSNGWEIVAACDTLSGNVRAIGFESGAVAWVATDFNVYRIGDGLVTYEGLAPLAMAVGPEGTVWVARSPVSGAGLSYFDGSGWISQTTPIPVVSSLAVMPGGGLWITGGGRLFTLRDGEWMESQPPVTGVRALKIGPGPAGEALWALGDTAVARLGDAGWQTVVNARVPVADVAFDADGGLWLATPVGAVYVRP